MAKTIAVAGKGGTGKTTFCGMLIDWLCRTGKGPVLAVDADANSNLNEVLGVEVETTLGQIREEMERWGLDNAPLAGCVNLSDVGEIDCIHPGDKRTVGTRLAAMALNRIYGFKDLKCDGPVFRKATLSKDGKKVTLTFDNVTGWCRKGDYPERFELAGADGKYVQVKCCYTAKVPTVDLEVPAGLKPKKVAYLRKSCVHSFLKNEAGIPLGPFRGDVAE